MKSIICMLGRGGVCAFACFLLATAGSAYGGPAVRLADANEEDHSGAQLTPVGSTSDGLFEASVAHDRSDRIYGTTISGGLYGNGTVYRLSWNGTKTILHSFSGGRDDGAAPLGGVIADAGGNLYGMASAGGGTGCAQAAGCGTIFRISPSGVESTLYAFKGGNDGATPVGNLVLGRGGRLYGTTRNGGPSGCGTVFEVSSAGEMKILHAFTPKEGTPALGVLHADEMGNLYGAMSGEHEALFRLTPDGTLTVLFQFA